MIGLKNNIRIDTGEEKKIGGRPRAEIDLDLVEKLASIFCTMEEISNILGLGLGTLSKRPDFTETYKKGKEKGKASLRRLQWKHAQTTPTMAIWLGKQYLGQKDTPDTDIDDTDNQLTFEGWN